MFSDGIECTLLAAATPVTKAHADTPYTIPDAGAAMYRTILADTSGGVLTVNLPTNPVGNEVVKVKRKTTDGTALTIGRNGKNIEGAAADLVDQNPALSAYELQYEAATSTWWQL